jgi:hypothetical protein
MMAPEPEKGKSTSPETTQATGTNGEINPNPFEVIRRILHSNLTPGAVRLLLEIADKAGHGRGKCWASVETMARLIHMSPGQARRILEALETDGWIASVRSGRTKFSRKVITLGPRSLSGPTGDCAPARQREAKGTDEPTRQRAPQAKRQREATLAPARSQLSAGAHQTSSITDPLTSSSTSQEKSDDDDVVSLLPEEKTPEGTLDDVCDVIKRCKHLPGGLEAKIREDATLAHRIKGDWIGLASAVMHLDSKIRDGDVRAKDIRKPLIYLLTALEELLDPVKTPPGYLAGLKDKVQAHKDRGPELKPEPVAVMTPRQEAMSENVTRRNLAILILKARREGKDWPEVCADLDEIVNRESATFGLDVAMTDQRRHWAGFEIYRAQNREEKAAKDKVAEADFFATFHKPESLPDHLRKAVQS